MGVCAWGSVHGVCVWESVHGSMCSVVIGEGDQGLVTDELHHGCGLYSLLLYTNLHVILSVRFRDFVVI